MDDKKQDMEEGTSTVSPLFRCKHLYNVHSEELLQNPDLTSTLVSNGKKVADEKYSWEVFLEKTDLPILSSLP